MKHRRGEPIMFIDGHSANLKQIQDAIKRRGEPRIEVIDGEEVGIVPLGNGVEMKVDPDMIETFRGARLVIRGNKYAAIFTDGKWVAVHKLVAGPNAVDHIDRDTFNNRRSNLRPATHQQNAYNRNPQKNNTSGYVGVHRSNRSRLKPWTSAISFNKRKYEIGRFATAEEAALARDQWAKRHHGEFARLNFPEV